MTFTFRPAKRENVALLIGLAGGTGSGKTYTAMSLAQGIAGDKPFAVIDTEAGRAKHYADRFRFDHGDLKPPFRPDAYAEAIRAADDAGYPVIVVDSASHEHAGEGGLLDWQEEELQRMAGDDWKRREACKMAAWIKPKTSHKAFVSKLLQVRAHLILCFRAEEKVEMRRGDNGKMEIVPKQSRAGRDGWIPICEKNLPFEMTCSFLLLADKPGFPHPIKLEEQHRHLFPVNQPINEAAGRAIAEWARGGEPAPRPDAPTPAATAPATPNDPELAHLHEQGEIAARDGTQSLKIWFGDLKASEQRKVKPYLDGTLKAMALKADHPKPEPPPASDRDELEELLAIKSEAVGETANIEDLNALNAWMKERLAGHDDLLGQWNGVVLGRQRELSNLKTKSSETAA